MEAFVKTVYRLSDLDWQLISDALAFAAPYSQSLKRAAAPINQRSRDVAGFVDEINASLDTLIDSSFTVRAKTFTSLDDWLFVEISKTGFHLNSNTEPANAALLATQLADTGSFWTTQLRVQIGPAHWLIGQPRQARYWSKTKARLLALELSEAGLFSSNKEHE